MSVHTAGCPFIGFRRPWDGRPLCATPRELVTERVDLGISCGYGTRLSAIFNATFFDAVAVHIDDFEDAIGEFVFIGVENSIQGRKRGRIILFGFRSD
jgi:hypothetical protein